MKAVIFTMIMCCLAYGDQIRATDARLTSAEDVESYINGVKSTKLTVSYEITSEEFKNLVTALPDDLDTLCLFGATIGDKGAETLVARSLLLLKDLDLTCNGLTTAGAITLSKGHWPALERLCVDANFVLAEGVTAIVDGTGYRNIKKLSLRQTGNEAKNKEIVSTRSWLSEVETIF